MEKRVVLLLGRSLLLSGVAASLGEDTDLCVTLVSTWADGEEQLLAERIPDVLILDLADTCDSQILPLLLKSPHLVVIGLDNEQNRAVLVSGQQAELLTLQQIRQIALAGLAPGPHHETTPVPR